MLKDYVYKLAESVRQLYPDVRDDYLFELEVSSLVMYLLNRAFAHIQTAVKAHEPA